MEILKTVLEEIRVNKDGKKGEPFTHVMKACPDFLPGSFYAPKEKENNLLIAVCNAVRNNIKLTIAEKGGPYTPLRVDFDFKSNLENGCKRSYTIKDLKCLVKYYQDEIRNVVDIAEFRNEILTCIVLEKEAARIEDGVVKDGFHFHFPNFICEAKIQDIYLRDRVVAKVIDNEDLLKIPGLITKREDIIDKNIANKPWMMYGAMNFKSFQTTPYLYNRKQKIVNDPWASLEGEEWGHVFDYELNEIPIYDVFADEMVGRKNSVKYYLPMFMSIRGYTETTPIKTEIERKIMMSTMRPKRKGNKIINKNRSDKDVYEDLKIISDGHIMDMLSADRASSYKDWIDVGWILFNISNGKEEGLNLWIEFSQKSPDNYKPGECEDLWETMEVRNKTLGGLLALARKDSPELYNRWKNTNKRSYQYKSVLPAKPNEYDVGMVAVASAGGKFICANPKKDLWYAFEDHRWRRSNDALALKRMLVDDVIQDYYEFLNEMTAEMKDPTVQDTRRTTLELYCKKTLAIIDQLKHVAFQKHVIEMCKLRLTDENFIKKADANRMLVCCENGVLDLEMGIFRDGIPDDYCTLSTGIYYQEYESDDPDVIEFDEYFLKIFPNKNLREYYFDMVTSCLQGGNVNKRIFICTGSSNGGKSLTMRMLEIAFGELFGKFPRELFLRGKGSSSGQARPELMKADNKRIMSTQEITHMDNFDIGPLKEMTGNDSVSARGLFQEEQRDLIFQFTTIFQCNVPPKVPGHDEATWSRIRLLDFESKFVIESDLHLYPVPETFEEQLKMKRFHADPNLANRIADMAPVLLWKIFHHFSVYRKRGLKEPKEVMISTDKYKTSNDIYRQFYSEKIDKVPLDDEKRDAKKAFITSSALYSEFKDWYRENHPSYARDMIGCSAMKKEMVKIMGQIKDPEKDIYGLGDRNRFWGYEILYDEDGADDVQSKLNGKT